MGLETQNYLEAKGAPNGAKMQKIDYTMKDTYFLNVSTALTEQSLFGSNTGVDNKMYKRGYFPLGNQAFTITHIRIMPFVAFTVATNALQFNNYIAHLLEDSFLEFVIEGKETLVYPMHRGVPIEAVPLLADIPAATNALTGVREKFNTYDKLSDPLVVGKNKDMKVTFKPATGLTTQASVANQNYVWPSAGLTSDLGFAIMFYLRGYLERENY